MKLIKQTILSFREGSSDKVYEVDLCEVGTNRYVVNFRYGRRGSALKEGAKTVSAVPLPEAERIFNDLVDSKKKKGYQEGTASGPVSQPARPAAVSPATNLDANAAREQAILRRLSAPAATGTSTSTSGKKKKKGQWPLERVIWRAGELKIRAAAPLLINLIGSGGPLRDYCIAWALGWCGDETVISALGRLYGDRATTDAVRRIAGEALFKLSDENTRREFSHDMIEQLPNDLREAARKGPPEYFAGVLEAYLSTNKYQRFTVLDQLYLIDNENVRPALLELIRTAPLQPNYFQRFRHIFKAAEYRRDAEVFGRLAYRFEKEKEMFNESYYYISYTINGQYHSEPKDNIKKADAKFCYGYKTRCYLRKRVWRTLNELGKAGDKDYVKMAVGVLLPFTDADADTPREEQRYINRSTQTVRWDRYARYLVLNNILFQHSPRYQHRKGTMFWVCKPNYRPGGPVPEKREEAFPKLWQEMPIGLLHLLSESHCEEVHHFAVKALRDCTDFCAQLDRDALLMLLERPYEVTARFGFELAQQHYRPDSPDLELVAAIANCSFADARQQAQQWINQRRELFLRDGEFLLSLVTSRHSDTRAFARNLISASVLPESISRVLIGRLIAQMLQLDAQQAALAGDIGNLLTSSFSGYLRGLGIKVILDLLHHQLVEVQELGGKILLNHEIRPSDLPSEIISSLINSQYAAIRAIGIGLLAQFTDALLLDREQLMISLLIHRMGDVRAAIRPVIKRLTAVNNQAFNQQLITDLVEYLLETNDTEINGSIVEMMVADLPVNWMKLVSKDRIWRLLNAKSSAAKELAGRLITFNINTDNDWALSFDINELVKLSDHEIKAVREASWQIFAKLMARCQANSNPDHHNEMAKAIRLLDAKWEDSREHWFNIFRNIFTADDYSPAILVAICDSTKEPVQRFGRELISRYFQQEAGQEYMLKLSEHPSADLQLFVSNYLENYAAGDLARLRELAPYFISVLCRVNKSRVAKDRILTFLNQEATSSEAAARVIAEILTRQSVTVAIGDKATAIETMVKIRHLYPHVQLPIHIRPLEVRNGV